MGIKKPIVVEIAHKTWCINEFGMDTLFLLEGEENTLLIDCGTGVWNFAKLVAEISSKPLIVAVTHGHVDHAGGMFFFPEVYMHPDDFNMAKSVSDDVRRMYVDIMMGMSNEIYDITSANVIGKTKNTKLLPLREGDIIQLGNRDVEVYETPGHTPGGLSFLDKKERIIFTGDACNMNTLLSIGDMSGGNDRPKSTISVLKKAAEKIESLHSMYDRNYNGHIGYADMLNMFSMPENLTKDAIELCSKILEGKVKGTPVYGNSFTGDCLVVDNKTMKIQYVEEQVK